MLAFIGAFAVRFYLLYFSNVMTPDGVLYIKYARLIGSGAWEKVAEFSFIHLYLFLVSLSYKVFPDWEMAGRMVSVLMGSLTVIPFFLLIKGMFGVRIAAISSFFYVINPRLADYSSDVLREPAFWFFSVTALWLAWEGISKRNFLYLILSSFSTGLSIFTRIEGVSVFAVIFIWMIWYYLKCDRDPKRLLQSLLIFIFILPVLLLPFLVLLRVKLGQWDLSDAMVKIPGLLMTNNIEALELTTDVSQTMPTKLAIFVELAKSHKYVIFLSDTILKLIKSINVVFVFLAIMGIFGRKSINYNKNEIPAAIWFGVFFLTAFIYITKTHYLSARHGLLMGIPLLIWSGIGFFELNDRISLWLKKVRPAHFLTRNITAVLIFAVLIAILPMTLSPGGYEKRELKKAGIYLKSMGYSGVVFAGEPRLYRIAFYANSEFNPLPSAETIDELVGFMRENKAKFLILDKKTDNAFYKNIQNSLDPSLFEKTMLPELEKFQEYKIYVYRLKRG